MRARLSLTKFVAEALDGRHFRGKGRLLDRLCPPSGAAERNLFGRPVSLDLGEHIQRWIFLGIYEAEPTMLVKAYLRPGMIVADVGANVGYYSLLAVSLVGANGRVLAFEPAERPRQRLQAFLRGVDNVEVLDCALGAQACDASLYVDREPSNDTPTMVASEGGVPVPVRVETLDDCLEARGIDRVDLIKLDVEGWEPSVIAGAARILARQAVGAILCELNDYWLSRVGSGAEDLHQQLLRHGFRDSTPHRSVRAFETRLFIHESRGRA